MQKQMMASEDEHTNWPWSVQVAEKENAWSSASKSSSHSSEDNDEEDASLSSSESSSGSPARGLQFELEETPFPLLPPPVSSQVAHSIPYGVLDQGGGVRFFDGTKVDSAGNWSSKLRYVDEVDAVRKQLIVKSLGKMKHE